MEGEVDFIHNILRRHSLAKGLLFSFVEAGRGRKRECPKSRRSKISQEASSRGLDGWLCVCLWQFVWAVSCLVDSRSCLFLLMQRSITQPNSFTVLGTFRAMTSTVTMSTIWRGSLSIRETWFSVLIVFRGPLFRDPAGLWGARNGVVNFAW